GRGPGRRWPYRRARAARRARTDPRSTSLLALQLGVPRRHTAMPGGLVALIALLVLLGLLLLGLGLRRRWRGGRAGGPVHQPRGDRLDAGADRVREVGVRDRRLEVVGGQRRAAGLAGVEVGRDAVAELGEVVGRRLRDGWGRRWCRGRARAGAA